MFSYTPDPAKVGLRAGTVMREDGDGDDDSNTRVLFHDGYDNVVKECVGMDEAMRFWSEHQAQRREETKREFLLAASKSAGSTYGSLDSSVSSSDAPKQESTALSTAHSMPQ